MTEISLLFFFAVIFLGREWFSSREKAALNEQVRELAARIQAGDSQTFQMEKISAEPPKEYISGDDELETIAWRMQNGYDVPHDEQERVMRAYKNAVD
jgi:hypothetical protein